MINQTVLLLARWAENAEHGVNEMAGSLPRTNFSPTPDDPAPPTVSVCSDVNDKGVAENLDPEDVPALMFWGVNDVNIDYKGRPAYTVAKRITIAAAYVTAEDANPLDAVRDCGYILRGGRITFISRFNKQNFSADFRDLNGIKVIEVESVNEIRITAAVGRRKMWGLLEITVIAIETLS